MQVIQLRSKDRTELRPRYGQNPTEDDAALVLQTGDAKVYKPDGSPLLVIQRGALSEQAAADAYEFAKGLRNVTTDNRGHVAGGRKPSFKRDGSLQKRSRTVPIRSATVGYMDRGANIPFCRESTYTRMKPETWSPASQAIYRESGEVLRRHLPQRYDAQMAAVKQTPREWIIPGTPFTSCTINNTHASGLHTDAGDYEPGFGVMAMLRRGQYEGAELVIPAYRVAVDIRHRDVVLFDVHEVHGNRPFRNTVGEPLVDYERIGWVMYFRKHMVDCGTVAEEVARAQARGAIDLDEEDDGEGATE